MAGATKERPVFFQLHTSVTDPRGLTVRLHEVAGFGFMALQNKMLESRGSVNALYLPTVPSFVYLFIRDKDKKNNKKSVGLDNL